MGTLTGDLALETWMEKLARRDLLDHRRVRAVSTLSETVRDGTFENVTPFTQSL